MSTRAAVPAGPQGLLRSQGARTAVRSTELTQ